MSRHTGIFLAVHSLFFSTPRFSLKRVHRKKKPEIERHAEESRSFQSLFIFLKEGFSQDRNSSLTFISTFIFLLSVTKLRNLRGKFATFPKRLMGSFSKNIYFSQNISKLSSILNWHSSRFSLLICLLTLIKQRTLIS